MVNWKTYRIIKLERKLGRSSGLKFADLHLDGSVEYDRNDSNNEISFRDYYPCDSLQAGDYVEIDLDYTRTRSFNEILENTNAIRKLSSSAITSSSSGGLTISTTPSSAAEVARTVTQTALDHADRTGGIPQIEIGTDKTSIRYYPPRK